MRSVVVNGGRAIEVPFSIQAHLAEVVADTTTNNFQKHEKFCVALSIGRFQPASTHKPYALRACILQVYDESRCIATYGGWHECYHCHRNLDLKPPGQICLDCGKKGIQNYKNPTVEVRKKIKKSP